MKKLSTEEVKKIQLEILDVVASFCEENGINYWLDGGTLLGAVRHKGYIPWDDDIDIGMLRPDYDRFRALFNQKNERYKFNCTENDMPFLYPFGKVMDMTTVLREPYGYELHINIDVFVYDNAPDNDAIAKRMFKKRDRLRDLLTLRIKHDRPSGNLLRRTAVYIARGLVTPIPKERIIWEIANSSKKYADSDTKRVGDFTSFTETMCNKRVFDSFIDVEFEGKTYKAPIGYDEWLTGFYGDYMELPPIEERVTHHIFEAFA